MEKKDYDVIVAKNIAVIPKKNNFLISFIIGGVMGIFGQALIDIYSSLLNISNNDSIVLMIITLIFLGCLFTSLGFFDSLVELCKCGLIIPITGFAHSMMSAALEYKKEGLVTGIGVNMFKLSGSVIIFGVVSAYFFGLIRILLMEV